jgi:hypothetical protein
MHNWIKEFIARITGVAIGALVGAFLGAGTGLVGSFGGINGAIIFGFIGGLVGFFAVPDAVKFTGLLSSLKKKVGKQ